MHKHFCTDHYEYGNTIVQANSEQEAFDKLNDYLATQPDGVYTAQFCETVENVSKLKYLK